MLVHSGLLNILNRTSLPRILPWTSKRSLNRRRRRTQWCCVSKVRGLGDAKLPTISGAVLPNSSMAMENSGVAMAWVHVGPSACSFPTAETTYRLALEFHARFSFIFRPTVSQQKSMMLPTLSRCVDGNASRRIGQQRDSRMRLSDIECVMDKFNFNSPLVACFGVGVVWCDLGPQRRPVKDHSQLCDGRLPPCRGESTLHMVTFPIQPVSPFFFKPAGNKSGFF